MSEDAATTPRTPWHLWVVGILGFLWDSMGAFDYLMTQTQNESYMSNFTPEQLEFFYNFPTWVVAFWAMSMPAPTPSTSPTTIHFDADEVMRYSFRGGGSQKSDAATSLIWCWWPRFSKRIMLFRNTSLTAPVGPFLCLATITSAKPLTSSFSGL